MKLVSWIGDSRKSVKEFADEARQQAGYEIDRVQRGLEPSDWKPMPSIGIGAKEIRIHTAGEYRVIYVAKFAEAVYVLHAFAKKTRRTPKTEIELAAKRFRELVAERKKS